MAGNLPHYKHGPDSYQVSAAVTGGQLVVADGSSATTVSPAGAGGSSHGALNVLGVAGNDASPIVSQAGDTTSYGDPLVDISVLSDYVAVWHGVDANVTYAASATFGQKLQSAATGQVTPWDGNTPAAVVGICTQPGGVAAGSTVARARIF
jgi:hypothetical protein